MYKILFFILSAFILSTSINLTSAELKAQAKTQENADALFKKGKVLYDQKKFEQAFVFLEKAANMGHAEAQMHLGKMYFNGWGVKHDHEKAREWHKKAAAQGNRESIEKLKNFKHDDRRIETH